jgi:hypothetical protein
MVATTKCCATQDFCWTTSPTEKGWVCMNCEEQPGEPPGFSPALDREYTDIKVYCILVLLHEHNFVHVSNNTVGSGIVATVTRQCKEADIYDQYSIIQMLMVQMDHAAYWAETARSIVAGKDRRTRCACGELATCHQIGGASKCSNCYRGVLKKDS